MPAAAPFLTALLVSFPVALLAQAGAKPQPSRASGSAQSSYSIGPGDVLQVFVWKEPDLTKEVTVRIDGKISVLLLGDVQAAGRSPEELTEQITKELKRFLAAPAVTVSVLQANSTRIYVLGQVGRSGDFPLSGQLSVLQALALAGGFRDFAKTDSIIVVRRDGIVVPVNYKKLESGKEMGNNVLLKPGDTVIVP